MVLCLIYEHELGVQNCALHRQFCSGYLSKQRLGMHFGLQASFISLSTERKRQTNQHNKNTIKTLKQTNAHIGYTAI